MKLLSRPPIRTLGLLAGIALLSACSKTEQADNSEETPAVEAKSFFAPRPGETWKYKVQKEIPIELQLSELDASRHPEPTESGHLITFEQVRTCLGEREIEGLNEELTTIAITEDGKVLGEELYEISAVGIFSRGWIPAGVEDALANLLPEGVAIATANMQPGQQWQSAGTDPGTPFLFRVIERGKVTVPAGTFEAARIQITSEKISIHPITEEEHVTYLKRTLWFADGVGVVKEDIVYYGEQRVRVKQHSELVHWVVPTDKPEPAAVVVSTEGPREPVPDPVKFTPNILDEEEEAGPSSDQDENSEEEDDAPAEEDDDAPAEDALDPSDEEEEGADENED